MTSILEPKAPMPAANELPGPSAPADTQVEVVGRAKRRHASTSEKRRILAAADRCTQPGELGELGAMLRREGVYSSSLSTWRRQRDAAEAAALALGV